jgi:hypothetical protein
MIKYLNIKTKYGVETWDSVDRDNFNTFSEYKKEVRRLINEYKLMGYNMYLSQRKSNK